MGCSTGGGEDPRIQHRTIPSIGYAAQASDQAGGRMSIYPAKSQRGAPHHTNAANFARPSSAAQMGIVGNTFGATKSGTPRCADEESLRRRGNLEASASFSSHPHSTDDAGVIAPALPRFAGAFLRMAVTPSSLVPTATCPAPLPGGRWDAPFISGVCSPFAPSSARSVPPPFADRATFP